MAPPIIPAGCYVRCSPRLGVQFLGIVVGNPRRGVRVRVLGSERRRVIAYRNVERITFDEAYPNWAGRRRLAR